MNGRLFIQRRQLQQPEHFHQAMVLFSNQTNEETKMAMCIKCGYEYDDERRMLGYRVCLKCGDTDAHKVKHCIAPLNKSNYMLFTDATLLKQLNPKRTT